MPREISLQRLLTDFEYYCANLLVIKPKAAALCRMQLNAVQKILYYGIPHELRKNDRRFAFVLLDKGVQEYWQAQQPVRLYILKARQMGMSTFWMSYLFNRAHTRPGTNCMTVAQDDDATTGLFQMARAFYSYLPAQLRPQIKNSNARELAFQNPTGPGGLNSWIKTQTAGNKNIGRSKTIHHLHCCLSGESLVELVSGYEKRIDEIEVGDLVRTHTGVVAEVSAVSHRPAEEVSAGGVTLKICPWLSDESLHLTPDHQLWSPQGWWIAAKNLKVGDEVAYPIKPVSRELSTLEVFADLRPRPQGGGTIAKSGIVALNKEFGFFVGYYLAEGSLIKNATTQGLSPSGIMLAHHEKEGHFADRAKASVEHLISSSRRTQNKGTLSAKTILYSGALAATILREFGERDSKQIPEWVFRAGTDFLAGIWEGYCAGDGSKADPDNHISITSVRRHLLVQLRYIVAALNLGWPGLQKIHNGYVDSRGWICRPAWALRWSAGEKKPHIRKWRREGNTIWVKIKSIEESTTDIVYDLEVNHPDHSFVTAGGSVKNSECSFWINPEAVVDGLFEAVPGNPDTSIVIETTAEGLGTWAYHAWLIAKESRAQGQPGALNPIFIPWFLLPEYAKPFPSSYEFSQDDKDFKDEYGLTWEQVYWYKDKLSSFEQRHPGRGLNKMKTEYPSNDFEPWQAAGESAFPDIIVDLIYKYQIQNPSRRFTVDRGKLIPDPNGALRMWDPVQPGVQYAIGVDTAHGVGRDYSVISVIAHPGYRQVAEWSDNRTGGNKLAAIIKTIATYYNEAVVAVEVNGSGMLINAALFESYSNVYRWEYFDKQKQAETTKLGWQTTGPTKELLIDHANGLFTPDVRAVIRSEFVAEQMRLMRVAGVAQYEFLNHTGDHLMAWMIAVMCCWRKIARFDVGSEDVTHEVFEIKPGEEHLYDQKALDIINGTLAGDDFFGESRGGDSWVCN